MWITTWPLKSSGLYPVSNYKLQQKGRLFHFPWEMIPHGVRLKNCRKSVRFCLTAWDMATMTIRLNNHERGGVFSQILRTVASLAHFWCSCSLLNLNRPRSAVPVLTSISYKIKICLFRTDNESRYCVWIVYLWNYKYKHQQCSGNMYFLFQFCMNKWSTLIRILWFDLCSVLGNPRHEVLNWISATVSSFL